MAKIGRTPRRTSVIMFTTLAGSSFSSEGDMSLVDEDGAELFLSKDVVEHIVFTVGRMSRESVTFRAGLGGGRPSGEFVDPLTKIVGPRKRKRRG